jgi:outer membrane lipoprotein SlyB
MNTKKLAALIIMSGSLTLSGCASSLQGDTYSRDDARQVQNVQYGTVDSLRMVIIEGTKTPIGAAAGGVVGAVAGSTVGGGKGSIIAGVLGAVAGGLAGSAAEEGLTKEQGVELVIRKSDGQTISVVQQYEPNNPFQVGDRVRLMSLNGEVRVTR